MTWFDWSQFIVPPVLAGLAGVVLLVLHHVRKD